MCDHVCPEHPALPGYQSVMYPGTQVAAGCAAALPPIIYPMPYARPVISMLGPLPGAAACMPPHIYPAMSLGL